MPPVVNGGYMKSDSEKKVLNPSLEAILQAEMSSPGSEKLLEEADTVDARKCMNAMRTVGAALTQVIEDPVSSAEKFQKLMEEAGRVSRILLLRWGFNPEDRKNRWMLNVVEKSLVPHLSTQNPMSEDLITQLAHTLVERQIEYTDNNAWQNEGMIEIAVYKGVGTLVALQNEFNFGRKKTLDNDIQHLTDLVVDHAQNAMEELCPELTPHADRVTFYVLLLEQLFEIMEASWKRNAAKAHAALSGLSNEQMKTWKQANPEGFALSPIEETFKQNASRLLRLTLAARKQDKKSKK